MATLYLPIFNPPDGGVLTAMYSFQMHGILWSETRVDLRSWDCCQDFPAPIHGLILYQFFQQNDILWMSILSIFKPKASSARLCLSAVCINLRNEPASLVAVDEIYSR